MARPGREKTHGKLGIKKGGGARVTIHAHLRKKNRKARGCFPSKKRKAGDEERAGKKKRGRVYVLKKEEKSSIRLELGSTGSQEAWLFHGKKGCIRDRNAAGGWTETAAIPQGEKKEKGALILYPIEMGQKFVFLRASALKSKMSSQNDSSPENSAGRKKKQSKRRLEHLVSRKEEWE